MADEQNTDWITGELRRAAVTERAPSHLRLHIDEMSRQRSRRPSRRLLLVPAAGVLAALIVVLILALPGGTPGGPTIAQAAELGARAVQTTLSTPVTPTAQLSATYYRLTGVHFPKWTSDGSWKVVGESTNVLKGRKILTVDYRRGSQVVAYSVAESPLLRGQKSGFTSFGIPQRTVVSWRESNHSCLLSSTTVSRTALLKLAKS